MQSRKLDVFGRLYPEWFYLRRRYSMSGTLLLLILLTACGAPAEDTASLPVETPLAPVLTLLLPASNNLADADNEEASFTALEGAINARSGLLVDVRRMTRMAEALNAVCSTGEVLTAAWLDGLAYAAARAGNCGQPTLQLSPPDLTDAGEVDPAATDESDSATESAENTQATDDQATEEPAGDTNPLIGLPGVIVVDSRLGTTDLTAIETRTFCRPGLTDFYGWLLPTLVFQAANIDLNSDTVTVVDYDDTGEVLAAVSNGTCAMAGISQDVADAGLPENVVVAQVSPPIPYGVLMFPSGIDGGVRQTVTETLLAIAADPAAAALLLPLLDGAVPLPARPDDFAELSNFLATTGLDFASLGQ